MLTAIVIITSIAQIALSLFVFFRARNNLSYRLFFLVGVSLMAWAFANYLTISFINSPNLILLVRSILFLVVIQNAFFYMFARTFPDASWRHSLGWLKAYWLFTALAALATLSPFVFTAVAIQDGLPLTTPGPAIILFIVHSALSIEEAFRALIKKLRQSTGRQRNQIQILLFASVLTWVAIPFTNFVLTQVLNTTFFIKYGPLYTLAFASIIAYAMVTQRLFDIRLIVARSVAYTMLLATLGVTYGLLVFGITTAFFPSQAISDAQQFVYIIPAIVLAYTFQPLRGFFEQLTDRVFYRDRYDSRQVLNQLGGIFASQINIDTIIESSLRIIGHALKPVHAQVIVLDEHRIYRTATLGEPAPSISAKELKQLHKNLYLADELNPQPLRRLLDHYDISLALRLITQEGVVGFLLFGPKQSGSAYTDQDVKLAETIGPGLAVAIQNARSYEKIAEFNITLQQRIKEATKKLQHQNQRLKELDEAKDEFISMASHQLRTPLTSIKGYLSMLAEGDAGKLNKRQADFAELAFTSAQRMVYLIADMLNVSRINTGKLVIEKTPIDLAKVIRDEIKQLKRTAQAHGVTIQFAPPPAKLPLLNLDEGKMRQVIMNFLDNAMYYAPNSTVEVKLTHEAGQLKCMVIDHGIGVPEAQKEKLFKKFYRAPNAKRARPDGTGLGLYMAKMVVELQGGSIIFDSTEGKGSTFGFTFPLDIVAARDEAKKPKIQKAPV